MTEAETTETPTPDQAANRETTVCVVGGGPAGLMLGLLLARQGVVVTVLEKHADFLRDFRGDTVHPSTLDLLDELGLGEKVAQLPGHAAPVMSFAFADGTYPLADFRRMRGKHPYVLFVPQWDLLDLLAETARQYDNFTLLRSTEAVGVLRDGAGRVTGIRARATGDGDALPEFEIRAALTVACDGRGSTIRDALGLHPAEHASPMDVLWFRLPKADAGTRGLEVHIAPGGLMLQIDRGNYFQCAFVVPKGGYDDVRAAGLPAFRQRVTHMAPMLGPAADGLDAWDEVKLLTVRLNRLRRWYAPGVLLIGDAAHAMSPIGGVGINLAVQDAVATARLLGPKLVAGTLTDADLARVERRRQFPTVVTQAAQRLAQSKLVEPILGSGQSLSAPIPFRLLRRCPALRVLPAYFIGRGVRPERL
jgi:2-polyprenyl-6-methoxyphenol hydroxylase-like FAD-dependent oxidoreductase